ncbi:MAG: glycogen synthase [Candidatus Nanopelagicales bacterium]|jgi:starch synthase|nr:glycogen synthase [Candidatus Nanopelagicales bacterium]
MRIGLITREWPPEAYGGAGVHVEYLTRELRRLIDVDVQCWGAPREDATAHEVPATLADANASLQTMGISLAQVAALSDVELVHSHTWYANFAGHVGGLYLDVPHVISAHSLEPRRPWKAEQLGGGYRLSSWIEQTAYERADRIIAVSHGMRADVLDCYPDVDPDKVEVVHNGIDTELYQPDPGTDLLEAVGIDPSRPYVLFVGRITRQKGIAHLLKAAERMEADIPLVLIASSPDTPELGAEVEAGVAALREQKGAANMVWVNEHLSRGHLVQALTHAGVFACPSVYEPLGIVNLEAMACETAVVASDVGGIPEVVVEGETGRLVHYDEADPQGFEVAVGDALNAVMSDPARAEAMGRAGRQRAVEQFGWDRIAGMTVDVYQRAIDARS